MRAGYAAKRLVSRDFQAAGDINASSAPTDQTTHKKRPAPFSLRLSARERAYLEELAGSQPLGSYIRGRLLGDTIKKPAPVRRPRVNEEQLAAVLAQLGGSRLSSNLNQLAKHANMGTLDVTRDLESELEDACKAVAAMRDALFIALGMRLKHGLGEERT